MTDIMLGSFVYDITLTLFKVVILFLLMRFLDKLTKVKFNETRIEIYKNANVAVAIYRGFWVLAVACIVGFSG